MKKFISLLLLFILLGGLWAYQRFYFTSRVEKPSEIENTVPKTIIVPEQRPALFVNVYSVSLPKDGYIVVQENDNGNFGKILGNSRILAAGEVKEIFINLIRSTIDGETLNAVIYEDSGDQIFTPGLDLPIKNEYGEVLFTKFKININAPQIP